jgi:hypothetical protein
MGAIPYSKVIPLVELGPDASITVLNPWMLPADKPLAAELLRPRQHDAEEAARLDQLETEIENRMREKLRLMVLGWTGIMDPTTGAPMPLPRDDETAVERCPAIVRRKLRQAIEAMELDMEWDPTRRRTPPPAPPRETLPSPPESDSAES